MQPRARSVYLCWSILVVGAWAACSSTAHPESPAKRPATSASPEAPRAVEPPATEAAARTQDDGGMRTCQWGERCALEQPKTVDFNGVPCRVLDRLSIDFKQRVARMVTNGAGDHVCSFRGDVLSFSPDELRARDAEFGCSVILKREGTCWVVSNKDKCLREYCGPSAFLEGARFCDPRPFDPQQESWVEEGWSRDKCTATTQPSRRTP
jgi:hypothetical protein